MPRCEHHGGRLGCCAVALLPDGVWWHGCSPLSSFRWVWRSILTFPAQEVRRLRSALVERGVLDDDGDTAWIDYTLSGTVTAVGADFCAWLGWPDDSALIGQPLATVMAGDAMVDAQRVLATLASDETITQLELHQQRYLQAGTAVEVYSQHDRWQRRGANVRVTVRPADDGSATKRAKHDHKM